MKFYLQNTVLSHYDIEVFPQFTGKNNFVTCIEYSYCETSNLRTNPCINCLSPSYPARMWRGRSSGPGTKFRTYRFRVRLPVFQALSYDAMSVQKGIFTQGLL